MSETLGYAAHGPMIDIWAFWDAKPKCDADCSQLQNGSAALDAVVADYLREAHAENTRRVYASDVRHFEAWGGKVPSSPHDIARYIAAHAGTLNTRTLRRRLAGIANAHREHGVIDPTKHLLIARLWRVIEYRHRSPPSQTTPLLIGDLARIVGGLGCSARDLRDKALLLVGFFGALRRSELVALDANDLKTNADAALLTIRRSKRISEGMGGACCCRGATMPLSRYRT